MIDAGHRPSSRVAPRPPVGARPGWATAWPGAHSPTNSLFGDSALPVPGGIGVPEALQESASRSAPVWWDLCCSG